jgi:hypothetical protein
MLEVMFYKIVHHTQMPIGSFGMDATSSFNRIAIALSMLLYRYMVATVLLQACYFMEISHGISPGSYTSTFRSPTHGLGQDSIIGPALWVLISCLMLQLMDSTRQGKEFCDPTQSYSHQHTSDGFVDDVDNNVFNYGLVAMLSSHYSENMIAQGMQSKAQTWEHLLWSTSGALELIN